jgi:nucleotide-binding universal stress UspA family protein
MKVVAMMTMQPGRAVTGRVTAPGYRIVVGVDGSPPSQAALGWALAEAAARGGEVVAVFAWQVPFMSFPGAFDRDELERAARQFLTETVSRVAPAPLVPLWPLVAEGDPAASLAEASKGASLLVLGSRSRSRLAGLLRGSVTRRCVKASACPYVLVTRSGELTGPVPARAR